tara:strand:- start:37 stop:882 length:846 start_codon:yes stop_codon:yes gene_type:complete
MREELIERTISKYGYLEFYSSDIFIGKSLKEYGEYSDIELNIMLNFINPEDFIFDIGANIGAFSIPFARRAGLSGRVFSFEPQEYIFELLKNNIYVNNLENVEIFKNGLGRNHKKIKIENINYSELGNFGGISLKEKNDKEVKIDKKKGMQNIKILKLDDFLNVDRCNFLKIDVESMEIDVLEGGRIFLRKFKPIIWIENHNSYPNKLNKYLINKNYKAYWVKSRLFNPNNFFKNNVNYFNQTCTQNVLAFPEDKDPKLDSKLFDKIIDENSEPTKVFTSL